MYENRNSICSFFGKKLAKRCWEPAGSWLKGKVEPFATYIEIHGSVESVVPMIAICLLIYTKYF